jgi:glycerate dehydrogenase
MKIIIVDGFTLHSNDIDKHYFDSLGNVIYYDRTPQDLVLERCKEAEVVITNKVPFDANTLRALPSLKLIAVAATGYNSIDTKTAQQQGIVVCNVPAYGTASVAQHIFALLLELSNHVGKNSVSVKNGAWATAIDWCFSHAPIIELAHKTLGIVGMGRIGEQTGRIAEAFGMKVIYYSRSPKTVTFEAKSLEAVFAESDFITLCCPATPDNTGFVNSQLLATMKKSAYLINASRGQLIIEQDLADALNTGIIAGAALDVLTQEPPGINNPLVMAKNCIITPHNAWISFEARQRIVDILYRNILEFQENNPINQVF